MSALRTLTTLAHGDLCFVNRVWEVVGPQSKRQTDLSLFALTFAYGQLKIKSPLWNQAWNSVPLVKLESVGLSRLSHPDRVLLRTWETQCSFTSLAGS